MHVSLNSEINCKLKDPENHTLPFTRIIKGTDKSSLGKIHRFLRCTMIRPSNLRSLILIRILAKERTLRKLRASSHEPNWPEWPGYRDQFRLGFIWKISAQFPIWEKAEYPCDRRANMAKRKIITFAPIIALTTLIAVSLQLDGMFMMWKI